MFRRKESEFFCIHRSILSLMIDSIRNRIGKRSVKFGIEIDYKKTLLGAQNENVLVSRCDTQMQFLYVF